MINLIVMLLILLAGSVLALFSGLFIQEEVYKLNTGQETGSIIGLIVSLTIFISSLYMANHFCNNKNRG